MRDRRTTQLTPAGEQLLADAAHCWPTPTPPDGEPGRGQGSDIFTVGFMPGLIVTAEVRALTTHHPEMKIEVVRTNWDDQTKVIHDGRVDVSYVRLPIDTRGLEVRPLLASLVFVVVLPVTNWRAKSRSVSPTSPTSTCCRTRRPCPSGATLRLNYAKRARPTTPYYRSVEEKLEHVAAGHGVIVLPLSTATFYTRQRRHACRRRGHCAQPVWWPGTAPEQSAHR